MRIEYSCDPDRLDRALIHDFLTRHSHWAGDLSRAQLDCAIDHSLVFAAYLDGRQVAFARVITDHATFAYLSDVFTLPEVRGMGIGCGLLDHLLQHPSLQRLRRFLLCSRDARPFYARHGFTGLEHAERFMELRARQPQAATLAA